ncbi:hypothetical protein [Actinoallomurus iriomotensis]|nr:hypothetical protein [Actinoallomurus iriomotensis]
MPLVVLAMTAALAYAAGKRQSTGARSGGRIKAAKRRARKARSRA